MVAISVPISQRHRDYFIIIVLCLRMFLDSMSSVLYIFGTTKNAKLGVNYFVCRNRYVF